MLITIGTERVKALFTLYRIAFPTDSKSYLVLCEQQSHRTGKSYLHTSNIAPEKLAERVWCRTNS